MADGATAVARDFVELGHIVRTINLSRCAGEVEAPLRRG
jgi:hypothetical protein